MAEKKDAAKGDVEMKDESKEAEKKEEKKVEEPKDPFYSKPSTLTNKASART